MHGYPEVQTEPAETWTPPDWPVEAGIGDGDGHPLTWGRVAQAHAWLVRHTSKTRAIRMRTLTLSSAAGCSST